MMTTKDLFNQTFAECLDAASHPECNVLVAHMWERASGEPNTEEGRQRRREEMDAIFGVMSGDNSILYDDVNYFADGKTFKADNFANRVQHGHSDAGLIGIAACPISSLGLPLFSEPTGILLKNPTPVFVSHTDSWSLYYEQGKDIPDQSAWETKCSNRRLMSMQRWRMRWALLHATLCLKKFFLQPVESLSNGQKC